MATELIVVTREGVNTQGIVGVFESHTLANEAIVKAKADEPDDYHSFDKTELKLNDLSVWLARDKTYERMYRG